MCVCVYIEVEKGRRRIEEEGGKDETRGREQEEEKGGGKETSGARELK